ncbi:MAG TPA: hypothetical protein VGO11_26160 [Chthoniobacteraceae bacterium]|nr:hypothetical protein [Chthoniobacteraceae bacterium]
MKLKTFPAPSSARRTIAGLLAGLFLLGRPIVADAEPVVVGREAQMFIDDYVVQSMRGVTRRIQPLVKNAENPVLRPERPWEENFALPISAFYDPDEQRYRMWYRPGHDKFRLAYATSPDGIQWDRPNLGLEEYKGSRENNIVPIYSGPAWGGVLKDVRDPDPARRYKLLTYNRASRSNGLYLFVSPDGLSWKPHSDLPLLEGLADCHTLMGWDPKISRYVAYVRPDKPIRTIARTTSEDMVKWAPFETVLEPDDDDPPGTQFYGMSVFPDRGVYLGLLWVYHANVLSIDVQLAFSRDGVKWERAARRHPILMFGLPDKFDSHLLIAMQPILRGDEIKVFYLGYDAPHAVVYNNEAYPPLTKALPRSEQPWLANRHGCGGLAGCLRDRFVAVEAGAEEGELLTKPFQFDGSVLNLNADATHGQILVEVRDENGKPIPGFSATHADPVRSDAVAIPVSWDSGTALASLKGHTVRLCFLMKDAKLFSFQVTP